ncbi:MAG: CHASE3 domain-containing protein [Caldimicrobium sp.]
MAKSLKTKIFLLYALGITFFALFLVVSYVTFRDVSDTLIMSEKGAFLVEYIFEMRRYEKNYLLYRTKEDLETLRIYLTETQKIIKEYRKCFSQLIGAKAFENFEQTLKNYEDLLKKLEKEENWDNQELLQKFRFFGKELTNYAEKLNTLRDKVILNSIEELKKWLFILLILFIFWFSFTDIIST